MKPICTTLSTQKYGILSSPELARVGALTGSPFTGCRLPWTRLSTSWTLALSLPQLTGIVVHKVVITLRTHIFMKLGCERGKWQLDSEWWSPVESMLLWDGLNSSLWKYHCGGERAQEWGGAGTRRVRMRLDKIPEIWGMLRIVMAKCTLKDVIPGPVASLLAGNWNFHSGRRPSSKMTIEDGLPPPSRLSQSTLLASLLCFSCWLVSLGSYCRISQPFFATILGNALCVCCFFIH